MGIQINAFTLVKSIVSDLELKSSDRYYLMKRFRNEGVTFLTVTLPKYSKELLRWLEDGFITTPANGSKLTNFAWKNSAPLFLGGLLQQIFDKNGILLESPCPLSIWTIRQICDYFYKLSLPFDERVIEKAEEDFITEDSQLGADFEGCDPNFIDQLRKDFETYYPKISRTQLYEVFTYARPRTSAGTYSGCNPRTFYADRVQDTVINGILHKYKAFKGYFKPYASCHISQHLVEDTASCSELLFVPKDSRGPRTIVREPLQNLKAQLAFFDWFTSQIESASHRRINFQDQGINRMLAKASSVTKRDATIDLKNASDRVSYRIVKTIFRNSPAIMHFISNRTKIVKTPSGRFHELNKLSGMGSGLTFPIMSVLAHLAITRSVFNKAKHGLLKGLPKGCSYNDVAKRVYTYGDDIILPVEWLAIAKAALESVLLVVNSDKSYYKGNFRESCGGDYYSGHDVAPLRLRLSNCNPVFIDGDIHLSGTLPLKSVCEHALLCAKNGLTNVSNYLVSLLEAQVGTLPVYAGEASFLRKYGLFLDSGEPEKVILVNPKKVEAPLMSETFFLGRLLQMAGKSVYEFEGKFAQGSGIDFGVVEKPRQVTYKRVTKILDKLGSLYDPI